MQHRPPLTPSKLHNRRHRGGQQPCCVGCVGQDCHSRCDGNMCTAPCATSRRLNATAPYAICHALCSALPLQQPTQTTMHACAALWDMRGCMHAYGRARAYTCCRHTGQSLARASGYGS
eukprot:359236-Chlamydomonas_euryale.AAC.2